MSHFEPLSPVERMQLGLEDEHIHMQAAAVCIFDASPLRRDDGGIEIDRIRHLVEGRLYRVPRLRQRLVDGWGEPVWIDDPSFNLLYHVRHTHLPLPGDERQLKRLVGQIVSQRLDRERPLWELWVIEGLSENRFAIVAKAHQAITRGVWGIGLVETLLSATRHPETTGAPAWLPRKRPGFSDLAGDAAWRTVTRPFRVLASLAREARAPDAFAAEARQAWTALRSTRPASDTPFNQPVGPHRRFDWLALDGAQADHVANHFQVPRDAVALAALAGAVSRFFEQRGIAPVRQQHMHFRVALPEHAGSLLDESDRGDALAWQLFELPLAQGDARRRMKEIAQRLGRAERVSYERLSAASELVWPGLPSALAKRQLGGRVSNLTLALFPGPDEALSLLGAKLLETYPLLPLVPNQAVRIGIVRYADRLLVGINSDWDLLPDLHDLALALRESFEELAKAAVD